MTNQSKNYQVTATEDVSAVGEHNRPYSEWLGIRMPIAVTLLFAVVMYTIGGIIAGIAYRSTRATRGGWVNGPPHDIISHLLRDVLTQRVTLHSPVALILIYYYWLVGTVKRKWPGFLLNVARLTHQNCTYIDDSMPALTATKMYGYGTHLIVVGPAFMSFGSGVLLFVLLQWIFCRPIISRRTHEISYLINNK